MYCVKNSKDKIKIRKDLFVWSFILVVMAAIAVGGLGQGTVKAGTDEGIEIVGPAGSSSGDTSPIQSVLRLKSDMTIRDALRFLQEKYRKNIVPSAKVNGLVTAVTLYDMTFDSALNAILGYAYKYEQKDNIIWVYTADEYKKIMEDNGRMIHRVFTLYYITAEEAKRLVTPVLSGVGNAKIAASTPAETNISGGGSSGSSGGGGSLASGGGGDSMALHDTIVVYDFPENIEKVEEVIKALDIRPKQVLVEATILSALLTEGMEFGVNLNMLGGVALDGTSATEQIGTTSSLLTTITSPISQVAAGVVGSALETTGFASIGGGGLRIGVRSGNVAAFITALESITDVTVLANPKILAVNKQEGAVLIGRKLGYRESTSVTAAGTETKGVVKFFETGTRLVFRPYIGNDGYIRMDIYPKDSTAELNDEKVPDETTTELQTNILIRDGETIVIGGLFRDVVTTSRSQIPLLGDLPFIGGLFRSTNDTVQRQEVIILLTVTIIDGADQTGGQERADDIRRKRFGAKDELQWIGRARLAEDRYAKAAKYYIENDNESAMRELSIVLELRPGYLEAIRLKERIIFETDPTAELNIERIMLEDFEREDSEKFMRR